MCWSQVPHRQQAVAKAKLRAAAYAATRRQAECKRKEFEAWCHRHGHGKAAETLGRDWERIATFYRYPKEHWRAKAIRSSSTVVILVDTERPRLLDIFSRTAVSFSDVRQLVYTAPAESAF